MRAMVFPGQGSQSVGMVAELAAQYPLIQSTFATASDVLGYDLWELVSQGPSDALNETQRTQPALLTTSVAIYRLLQQQGVAAPAYLAGHSLGEYSALVCAGVIDFEAAVAIVAKRGEFMQSAVPAGIGGMAAIIGLDDDAVRVCCAEAAGSEVVAAVNYNSPGQVVIAGHAAAVTRAGEACKAAGAKRALPLPVSVPSHCELMRPAAEKLEQLLAQTSFHTPTLAVVNNVDVAIETDAGAIKDALIRQLYSPVRWTETVEFLAEQAVTEFYEIGPGKVLTGLIKRIANGSVVDAINTPAGLDSLTNSASSE